ncbi:MAG: efflux RND transporter permease subunit, partial [Planctomycetota bacterium]
MSEKQDDPGGTSKLQELAARFYTDRRLVVLCILLVIASGVSSLFILPRMEDPLLTQRAANVLTVFPGADAEKVEALVTEKIEKRLLDIPELKRLRSQSRAGSSFITIELRDDIYDTDPVWSDLRGKIEDSISELPPGAQRPIFDELEIAAYAWIGAVVWEGKEKPVPGIVRRLAKDLKDRFLTLQGTKSVDIFGDPGEEIVVDIEPTKAAAAGLSAASVALQLAQADTKSTAGILSGEKAELVVEMGNEFHSLQDISEATLSTGNPGERLRLEDIADITRSTPLPPEAMVLIDGKFGVCVSVMLRPEYRIDQWAESARAIVNEYRAELPEDLGLDIVMEQEVYVADRMNSLARNLLLGVSAVALVTLIFMGWRSAILVTATLPIASLMVVAGMRFLGIPIHQMSVTGLIIALGLMIDNAIIATDEIQLSMKRGLSPSKAVRDLVRRLFAPLLASTVTTALAFAPIALMEGPAGEFVGAIAITVMLAIFSSFLLAMTILPAMAALLQASVFRDAANATDQHGGSLREMGFIRTLTTYGITVPLVTNGYRRALTWMLRYPVSGVLFGCVLPIAGFIAFGQLNEQFFPPADRDQFHIEVELAPQASIEQTQDLAGRIDARLRTEARIQGTSWFIGESAPPFYYNIIARRKNAPNYGQAIVSLDSNRNVLTLIRRFQRVLDREFPEARILVRQLEQGPPFDAPVELRLLGPDVERLTELGNELRRIITTRADVLHARTLLGERRPTANVKVDSQVSQWAGLSEVEVGQQLFASYEGLLAGSIIEQVEEVPVRVRLARTRRGSFEDIGQTQLLVSRPNMPAGSKASQLSPVLSQFALLDEIADVELRPQ